MTPDEVGAFGGLTVIAFFRRCLLGDAMGREPRSIVIAAFDFSSPWKPASRRKPSASSRRAMVRSVMFILPLRMRDTWLRSTPILSARSF